jgi:MYXO-CTERM domain-containing protein
LESVFDVVVSINPITNVALTSSTITQNTSAGSVVGTLSANHALDGEVNFSLVDGVTDNAGFEIDGDEVKTSESLARSDNGTYSLVVVASDGEYSVERTVTVVVNIPALVTPEPPSSGGGGGCTVGAPGQSDGSLPLLMLGLALMWIRRRMIG